MSFLKTLALGAATLGAAVALAGSAAATTTLTYVGNDFNYRVGPYQFGDRVTGTVELEDPLGANFFGEATPLSMTLTVGGMALSTPNLSRARFATNAAGEIVNWQVSIYALIGDDYFSFTTSNTAVNQFGVYGGVLDYASLDSVSQSAPSSGASNTFAPGVWTMTTSTDPTVVPEPATWAMMLSGFALTGGLLRRRRALPDAVV